MAKENNDKMLTGEFDWKPEDPDIFKETDNDLKDNPKTESQNSNSKKGDTEAVVLTEEQKQILLREEIRRANRQGEGDTNSSTKKNRKNKGVDFKVRKIGSTASTITAIIFTVISFLIVYYVMSSGDWGKIIALGLIVVLPMELISIVLSVAVFITNIVFMSTGRFSFMVFLNFVLSLALIGINIFIFYMGAEMLTA